MKTHCDITNDVPNVESAMVSKQALNNEKANNNFNRIYDNIKSEYNHWIKQYIRC